MMSRDREHSAYLSSPRVGVGLPLRQRDDAQPQVISNSMSVRIGLAETGRLLTMVVPAMLRFGAAGRR
jgi:hypothetical protein